MIAIAKIFFGMNVAILVVAALIIPIVILLVMFIIDFIVEKTRRIR